jgi:hypothetical protein
MNRFLAISQQLAAFSNIALAIAMAGLFVTTGVLILRGK